ncbi:MAG: leucyl aminopeptidase family protein [Rhizobiales bacterium]|nr:leucyl aminopeptidase family protein [Hyphomicrobiales bacterium]
MTAFDRLLTPASTARRAIPIIPVTARDLKAQVAKLSPAQRRWIELHDYKAKPASHLVVSDSAGALAKVYFGLGEDSAGRDPFEFGKLSRLLPAAEYRIDGALPDARLAVLGWLLEAYSFDRYRKGGSLPARLQCPGDVDRGDVLSAAEATGLVRDLINTPASDLGPAELEAAARKIARRFKAKVKVVSGRELERKFPMIYAVGKASPRAPRLIDFTWGPARAPRVTLVGKGVCFDTGGLDIKPPSGMLLMKKDMGGAANVLGLARMIMTAELNVRLRVLIPAVENSVDGSAFRPGDVLTSRKGITVEIGNTDAEGRLILADALALADEEKPDLLIDMATLTGAARVALGPDLPPFYTDDDAFAGEISAAARAENDPLWRMPFWRPYYGLFESRIAELNNSSESAYAGSITAALFLKRFVESAKTYVHFDIFGWTPTAKPGRPRGGEAQGMRALFALIRSRYGR